MKLYHVTSCDNAAQIIKDGFHDPDAGRFADACVWFADKPLCGDKMFNDEQERTPGPQCAVVVDIPDHVADEYRDTDFEAEHPDHGEWCIPYDVVNQYMNTAELQLCP